MDKKYNELTLEEKIAKHLEYVKDEMSRYANLCKQLDDAYVPQARMYNGSWDLHPQNRVKGQAHVSIPVVFLTVNTKSNIVGMRPPHFNVRPLDRKDDKLRADAEFIETLLEKSYVDENLEEAHLNLNRNLSLYGRAILQDGDGFTVNIDQQYNVWVSYKRIGEPEAFSFIELVSKGTAMDLGWDGTTAVEPLRANFPIYGGYNHSDPLGVISRNFMGRDKTLVNQGVPVLHFYSKNTENAVVRYSLVVNGQILKREQSLGRKSWPFQVVEAEHIPGSTIPVGDAEPVLDIQSEISERMSAWS